MFFDVTDAAGSSGGNNGVGNREFMHGISTGECEASKSCCTLEDGSAPSRDQGPAGSATAEYKDGLWGKNYCHEETNTPAQGRNTVFRWTKVGAYLGWEGIGKRNSFGGRNYNNNGLRFIKNEMYHASADPKHHARLYK